MNDEFKVRFLVVDDQPGIRKLCAAIGSSLGYICAEAESVEMALSRLETESPDIILADLRMAGMPGLKFLESVKKIFPRAEVAMTTGHDSIESAVQARNLDAYDYITKPFRTEELKLVLRRMAEKVRLVSENQFLRERVNDEMEMNGIVGSSSKIQDVLRMVARLKDTRTPVLITGERGTGKELVARAIHFRGSPAQRPFVAADCGAPEPALIESELFGCEKGAFTGALKAKMGLFQAAHGGTIFLDEVGELPLDMQTRLLRFLQEKEVRPVGGHEKTKVDVRVIAATSRDLEQACLSGSFRKDLYLRLNVVAIHVPALRERKTDIPYLVQWFLERSAPVRPAQVAPAAMNCLLQYNWPGNVRELENCIERALAVGNHERIDVSGLPPEIRDAVKPAEFSMPLPTSDLEEMERLTIERVYEQVKGDKSDAGKALGISRATLYRKLKRYGIGTKPATAAAGAGSK